MYAQHFGFTRPPFSIAPDPRSLYMSERHREALAHLLFGLNGGGGFVLLTGEIGAGKTTVCRAFIEQIPKRCNVAYIFNPKLTAIELLQTVCEELHIPHPGGADATVKPLVDGINEFLLRTHGVGQNTVLIIDEAQNLSADVLEQLRLLTNLETNERKLLQIILIGQPELRKMLARPELEQLAQRVIARYHLGSLSEDDTQRYIRHRQAMAGMSRPNVFKQAAMKRIHRLSGGVPRRINLLCDRALLGAYTQRAARVDVATVNLAAQEVFESDAWWRRLQRRLPRELSRRTWWLGGSVVAAGLAALLWQGRALLLPATGEDGHNASVATSPVPLDGADARTLRPTAPGASGSTASVTPAFATVPPPRWPASADAGWRMLVQAWGAPLNDSVVGGADPCAQAWALKLACLNGKGNLGLLKQMNRPTLLTLRGADGESAALGTAVLTGLSGDMAQLHADGVNYRLPLITLGRLWTGEFSTLWRMDFETGAQPQANPPGLKAWVGTQLDRLRQQGSVPDTASRKTRLQAFQKAEGLPADGNTNGLTMMQLNRAAQVAEPTLQTLD